MATAGVISGTLMRLQFTGNNIAYATNCQINFSREVRSTRSKDTTGNWRSISVGEISGTGTADLWFNFDGANNDPDTLFTALNDGTQLGAKITNGTSGDNEYVFSCYITGMDNGFPDNENSTVSITFEVDGAATFPAIA